ncbi:MAG: antitoxin family protein [Deltaproteobacteria bacterium]|nr:antitoxin family protein [Deltaproteobacteria bacterium]
MSKPIEAVFDGKVLRPKDALTLEPNPRVRITIEPVETSTKGAVSFLDTAISLKLDGPPDWAENIDAYLYGGEHQHES